MLSFQYIYIYIYMESGTKKRELEVVSLGRQKIHNNQCLFSQQMCSPISDTYVKANDDITLL